MTFFTVINCIDGRIQLPVIQYLQQKFKVEFIDSITEAGPNLILADNIDFSTIQSIYHKLDISFKLLSIIYSSAVILFLNSILVIILSFS